MIIGFGGASVMDSAKLMALGVKHEDDLWDYISMAKKPRGVDRLRLALMPTYPSSGSEYGLGAVSVNRQTGECGTAYGISADYAILCPKYSLSLSKEMTAYSGLVTLVQLSAAILGDKNPMSYDAGISYIKNILDATKALQENPNDLDARGTILIGASMSTSSRLGIGKETQFAYEIYELEFIPEILFKSTYRRGLTTIFPAFLRVMGRHHEEDIRRFFLDAFGWHGTIDDSCDRLTRLFAGFGIPMKFKGPVAKAAIEAIPCETELSEDEIFEIVSEITY